jgi:hypothetical protein
VRAGGQDRNQDLFQKQPMLEPPQPFQSEDIGGNVSPQDYFSQRPNIAALEQSVRDLERREQDLEKRVLMLEKQTNSWTGGFLAIASVGALLTFLAAFWDKITGAKH